ncbi:hypothetical protein CASFOL_030668 [Castilleja foliolosa]|uniref:Uncharacterized protein n=1 Tax=Castilleja foliolosa TaxID=1961234 RepID=A0ABD3C6K3_9LAMI
MASPTQNQNNPFALWSDHLSPRECKMALIQFFVVIWSCGIAKTKAGKWIGVGLQSLVFGTRFFFYCCRAIKGEWALSTYQLFCFLLSVTILGFEILRACSLV